MKHQFLKSTSIAAVSLSLALPTPGAAQQAAGALEAEFPELAAELDQKCLAQVGKFLEDSDADELADLLADGVTEDEIADLPPPQAECLVTAGDIMSRGVDGEDTAADDTPAESTPSPEIADEPAAAEVAEEASDGDMANDEADNAEEVAEDAPAETAETAEEATETPPAEDAAAEEAMADEDDAEAAESAPTEEMAEDTAPARGKSEDAPGRQKNADAGGEADTDTDAKSDMAASEDPAAEPETGVDGEQLEVTQEDTEETTEAANEVQEVAAAESVDGDETDPSATESEIEVITEETSRSSSEEFASSRDSGGGSGLSDFAKIAAGVAGGVILNELLGQDEQVVENTGDRLVVQRGNGEYYVLKDDNALIRRPGTEIRTETFDDGSTRQIATREDGTRIVTIRAANGQVLRRTRVLPDGRRIVLFDDTEEVEPVDPADLPESGSDTITIEELEEDALRQALAAEEADRGFDRRFSLAQIRNIRAVRNLVPIIELEAVTFDSGSAAIRPSQAEELAAIGRTLRDLIEDNPDEVFLIEGHTDAVGSAAMNLALSDRRAESVALALSEYFDVPPENLVVQGYGESNLKIPTSEAERENRRAAVRRITPLLRTARADQ